MKANITTRTTRLAVLLTAAAFTLTAAQVQAAPGTLSQQPQSLAKGVQPNIFFLLDDSWSMDSELLQRNGGSGSMPIMLDFSPNDDTERLQHCVGYNVLAYDPSVTYTPWVGVDRNGDAFADQDPENALVNPYLSPAPDAPAAPACGTSTVNGTSRTSRLLYDGVKCDLIGGFGGDGAVYYLWTDSDHDGLYDSGECATGNAQYVKDKSAAEQTNYANWFSYYRKREFVLKRAVSEVVAESSARMGMATINNNNHIARNDDDVGISVKDIDDLTLDADIATAKANKSALLDNILGIDSNMGDDGHWGKKYTPLKKNLRLVGNYFRNQDTGDLFNDASNDPPVDGDSADGFSPILDSSKGGTCQQNFVVMVTDGYYLYDSSPNVGNADADDADNPFDGQSYADGQPDTLADAAMYNYKNDLMPDLANDVPAVSIQQGSGSVACFDASGDKTQECYDINSAQHLVTFGVSFGLSGTIPETDGSGNACLPPNRSDSLSSQGWPSSCGASFNGWPIPDDNKPTALDDLMHAAWNSRGLFLNAKLPQQLISQLQQAIANINAKQSIASAAVAVNTFNFAAGGLVYQGRFDSAGWIGEVTARNIVGKTIGSQAWSAQEKFAAMDINDRILVTYNGAKGIPFDWSAGLSAVQKNDLLHNAPDPSNGDTYAESLIDYLRGDKSNEGAGSDDFRQRTSLLGDIINSAPVYVGDPNPELYPDTIATENYSTWANSLTTDTTPGAKGRQEMLYVGANDGALHAFNAKTGVEVFAYYPQAVFSEEERLGLHWWADPTYEHRYYVDMEPTVAEVFVNTGQIGDTDGETWRTLLVGGLRGGGRAMYAIDVSDPSEFTDAAGVAGNIVWEFTHDDLGYTYSKPTIAKLNDGRWAAIFGNGYNADGGTGKAALFIKYLDNATPAYKVIYTTAGSISNGDCADPGSVCNGLATPSVVDLGADQVADRVYAGDLLGNLWVFDLSSDTPANWKVDSDGGATVNSAPLFKANYRDTDGNVIPQPITVQPIVTMHPTERHDATSPNTMVFFGTGQYLTDLDAESEAKNTFYGIWDSGEPITLDRSASDPVLVEQVITNDETSDKTEARTITNNPVNYDFHKGWFADLPDTGERLINNPLVYIDLVIFSTSVPSVANDANVDRNPCEDASGYSWTMVLNLADGSEPDYIALDVTGDGTFDSSDQIDGHNAAGVKNNGMVDDPVAGQMDNGIILLVPNDSEETGIEGIGISPPNAIGSRSSWGLFRYDD